MAGQWIKFEVATSDKPEVWSIATQLDIDPDAVVGKLLRVWAWFDDQTQEGNAPSVTTSLLDRKVGVAGFCNAMVSVGWMEIVGDEVRLPNFVRHNGETAKKRALTARRVKAHKEKTNADGDAKVTPLVTHGALPKEEKRREEERRESRQDTLPGVHGPVGPPSCPHQQIIDLYHEILPQLPRIRIWTEKRKKQLQARWREDPKRQHPGWWRKFFTYIRDNQPFLLGENDRGWTADLEWILKQENFAKIYEGARYGSRAHA